MFPYAFNAPTDVTAPIGIINPTYYVWEYSIGGDMFFGTTKFKLGWTLYYTSLENALDYQLAPEHQPEFSIRIYSPGDGIAPWHYEALEYAADIFRKTMEFDKNM